jgi:hypothetical protein
MCIFPIWLAGIILPFYLMFQTPSIAMLYAALFLPFYLHGRMEFHKLKGEIEGLDEVWAEQDLDNNMSFRIADTDNSAGDEGGVLPRNHPGNAPRQRTFITRTASVSTMCSTDEDLPSYDEMIQEKEASEKNRNSTTQQWSRWSRAVINPDALERAPSRMLASQKGGSVAYVDRTNRIFPFCLAINLAVFASFVVAYTVDVPEIWRSVASTDFMSAPWCALTDVPRSHGWCHASVLFSLNDWYK